MTDRPILRLIRSDPAARLKGSRRSIPHPSGPGRRAQRERFQGSFDRLTDAFGSDNPTLELRQDPAGIAPERALVFVTAGSISGFARVAKELGIEIFSEFDLEDTEDFPEGFTPAGDRGALTPCLYATMPTIGSFNQLLGLWRAYDNEENAPYGAAPWWKLFDLLLEIRPWGPADRFTEGARAEIEDRLPENDDDEAILELEIWPTSNTQIRARWRRETEAKIDALGGRVIDRCSIDSSGFVYEAILAGLSAGAVRALIADPYTVDGLATVEGIQFILPQTIAQSPPVGDDSEDDECLPLEDFEPDLPVRAVLFDGTPVAAHPALIGGVEIEDVHDLVRLSQVNQRMHATSMASLILRGDLEADGVALAGSRLVSVPILVDSDDGASSPVNRLFVDVLHTALLRVFSGEAPLAPDAFIVNLSIGTYQNRFAGQISALARLIDWWAWKEGVLFVISIGNISEDLILPGVNAFDIEASGTAERQQHIRNALRLSAYDRTLLSPSEAINGISVGAISEDLAVVDDPPNIASVLRYEGDGESLPPVSNALGLGLRRCVKPDLLASGGVQEFRVWPGGNDTMMRALTESQRTGLFVASPRAGGVSPSRRVQGTSCATALTTRAVVQSAEALTAADGPYEGRELTRRDYALLTRALAVNSAQWPESAVRLYEEEKRRIGSSKHVQAKLETARYFGHGVISPLMMQESPEFGVTLVGFGNVQKDQAVDFAFPLPESLSGDRVPRSMRVSIAWFTPVNPARAAYRLASLEAIALDEDDEVEDKDWLLKLKSKDWDRTMIKRGSVWSRRLVHKRATVPTYSDDSALKIRVQCSDPTNGGLDPDLSLRFAIAATLEIEADVEYDVHEEIQAQLRLRVRGRG